MPSTRGKSPSPSKAKKKSPSRSRSRSRSRTTAKKPAASKSRSRSRGRPAKKTADAPITAVQTKSPARPAKSPARPAKSPARPAKSPARPKTPPRVQKKVEEPAIIPSRVSRRIQEKSTLQDLCDSLPVDSPSSPVERSILPTEFRSAPFSSLDKNDGMFTPYELTPYKTRKRSRHERGGAERPGVDMGRAERGADVYKTPPTQIPIRRGSNLVDKNNNAASTLPSLQAQRLADKVTKSTSVSGYGDAAVRKSSASAAASGTGPGKAGAFLVISVIALSYYLTMSCNKKSCTLFKLPTCPAKLDAFFSWDVMGIVTAFYVGMFLLAAVPVGSIVQGQPLADGRRLKYRLNGFLTLFVVGTLFGWAVQRGIPMDFVDKHYLHFVTSGVILSLVIALGVHVWQMNCAVKDRSPGADGTFFNDFWMGRALHPRLMGVDFKLVGIRASVVSWMLIDWTYLVARFKAAQTVEPALAFVVLCHTIYVLFAVRNEHTYPSSNDVRIEGFGYQYTWVTMCFIPFLFPLSAQFLYLYPKQGMTNPYAIAALFIVNVVGLAFFVGSNWQKNEFRKNPYNPDLTHLSSIPTATGKRILCSGWWGIVRRPNYLGDLLMAISWSIPCGCSHGLPYFYPFYLVILLVARVINDEASCKERYGDAWDKYTSIVKYRLIPGVF